MAKDIFGRSYDISGTILFVTNSFSPNGRIRIYIQKDSDLLLAAELPEKHGNFEKNEEVWLEGLLNSGILK